MKPTVKQITWKTITTKAKNIQPTLDNAKIKTDLGLKRLQASLDKFGMAGSVVCNYGKMKGTFDLINGNSRWEKIMSKDPNTLMEVSVPNRPLTPKEYREMADMFDFATAGEVDMDRVNAHHGSAKDFYKVWGIEPPLALMEQMGVKADIEPLEHPVKKGKTKEVEAVMLNDTMPVTLFFTSKEESEFRKIEEKLMKKFKTDNTTQTVFKALKGIK
jgi:hypothetical protein